MQGATGSMKSTWVYNQNRKTPTSKGFWLIYPLESLGLQISIHTTKRGRMNVKATMIMLAMGCPRISMDSISGLFF